MKHFHQPVKNNLVTYDNIGKITTGQGDDCTTGSLLDYFYFKNYYKMIAIDLSKQKAVDDNLKGIQANRFYCKSMLSRKHNVFHHWWSKRNCFRFFHKELWKYC